ncbi:MAG: regulatory protein GemA [Ignavibacterium sp.]|nr:regulatory protein GemA [Ignavibacterium sp.]
MNNPISKIQIQKIHIAKNQLNISDADYRAMLSGFKNVKGEPCTSSIEFTESQANVFLSLLKTKLGWQEKKRNKVLKYEELNKRDSKFASPAQLRKIEALWQVHSREKTVSSLNHFLSRILKVDLITAVLKKDVNKLLKAIESLKQEPSNNIKSTQ